MPLSTLKLSKYGPFDKLEIELDPDVNLFVGYNNTGKTAALCAIAEMAVYPFSLPRHFLHGSKSRGSLVCHRDRGKSIIHSGGLPVVVGNAKQDRHYREFLGGIGFSAFLPALRLSTDFRSEGPSKKKRKTRSIRMRVRDGRVVARDEVELFHDTTEDAEIDSGERRQSRSMRETEFARRRRLLETNARYIRDEDVIQQIIDLDYRYYRNDDKAIRKAVDAIVSVTSEITAGFKMEFVGIREDKRGLYIAISTPYGTVPLNTLSQGTQSVFQWVARLIIGLAAYYNESQNITNQRGIVLVDEADAHLHPTWQRRVLPTLKKYFPRLQVVCTAHSPLMIAGLKAGQVHLFSRETDGRVTVTRNEADIVGWTSDQVYQEFLGVSNPTDLETASATERLAILRSKVRLTSEDRKEVKRLSTAISRAALGSPPPPDLLIPPDQLAAESVLHAGVKTTRVRRKRSRGGR